MSNHNLTYYNPQNYHDIRDKQYAISLNMNICNSNKNKQLNYGSYSNDNVYPIGSNGIYMTHMHSGSTYSVGRSIW